jgi:regulatory protein
MQDVILNKLRHYCAYQERCHEEVRTKLLSLKVYGDGLEEIINHLISEDFLNEERFAKAYAGGKFRMKKWGRGKIIQGLKARKISDYCIKQGMIEIPEEDYQKTLQSLVKSAIKKYHSGNVFETKSKTAGYLIGRGYESELVWDAIQRNLK